MTLTGLPGYYGIFSLLTVLLIFSLRQKLHMSFKEVGALLALAAIIGIIIPFSLSIIGVWWTVILAVLSLVSVGTAVVLVRLREDRMVEGQLTKVLKPVDSILPIRNEREPAWEETAVSLEDNPLEVVVTDPSTVGEVDQVAQESLDNQQPLVLPQEDEEPAQEESEPDEPTLTEAASDEEPDHEESEPDEPMLTEVASEEPDQEEPEPDEQPLTEAASEEPDQEAPEPDEPMLTEAASDEEPAQEAPEPDEPMLTEAASDEEPAQEAPEPDEPVRELDNQIEAINETAPPRVRSEQELLQVQNLYLAATDSLRKQDYTAALRDLKKALEYEPPFAARRMIINDYVRILHEMGLYQQSIHMLQKLIQNIPQNQRKIEMEIIHQIKYIENIIRLLQEQNRNNLPWSLVSPELRKRAEESLWTYIGSTIS